MLSSSAQLQPTPASALADVRRNEATNTNTSDMTTPKTNGRRRKKLGGLSLNGRLNKKKNRSDVKKRLRDLDTNRRHWMNKHGKFCMRNYTKGESIDDDIV